MRGKSWERTKRGLFTSFSVTSIFTGETWREKAPRGAEKGSGCWAYVEPPAFSRGIFAFGFSCENTCPPRKQTMSSCSLLHSWQSEHLLTIYPFTNATDSWHLKSCSARLDSRMIWPIVVSWLCRGDYGVHHLRGAGNSNATLAGFAYLTTINVVVLFHCSMLRQQSHALDIF